MEGRETFLYISSIFPAKTSLWILYSNGVETRLYWNLVKARISYVGTHVLHSCYKWSAHGFRIDDCSFFNGDNRWAIKRKFLETEFRGKKNITLFIPIYISISRHRLYYPWTRNENVSPLFAFVFIDAVMSKWKPRVNARVGSTPISPPLSPRQRRIRGVIKRTREQRPPVYYNTDRSCRKS